MKHVLPILCVLLSAVMTLSAADDVQSATEGKGAQILRKNPDADLNGDGILTREEFREYKDRPDGSASQVEKPRGEPRIKITPTLANIPYLPHVANVIDFYKAESDEPTPLVLYIHGGAFRGGSKNGISQGALKPLLDAGVSVAAIEYRLIGVAPLPAAHRDCARALQFIRSKATDWNLDKRRIGAFGGSAGAQICMWLAFHDDMAKSKSEDPIERESTRLSCVATKGSQTTMDLQWWIENIPGYETPHRDPEESYRTTDREEIAKIVKEISVINHLTKDDPPLFMTYFQNPEDPVPSDPKKASNWSAHHVQFGLALKAKADALGLETDLQHPRSNSKYDSQTAFFMEHIWKQ